MSQPPPPPPSGPHRRLRNVLLVSGGALLLIIVLALAFGGGRNPGKSAAATQHSATPSPGPTERGTDHPGQTVTFEATGAPSTVSLGKQGSESEQSGPVTVTSRVDSGATAYKLTVSPTATGTSHCRIKVNGRTLASGTASGSVAIATCAIHQNPASGAWSGGTP